MATFTVNPILLSPLEQFDVLPLGWGLTNSALFLFVTTALLVAFFTVIRQNGAWVPAKDSVITHLMENIISQLVTLVARNTGYQTGQLYFTWLAAVALMVGGLNLVGMIPYTFTVTSHIIVTFTLAFLIFGGINVRALIDRKTDFFSLFLPSGAPIVIAPFLVVIELISYIARVFSLSIRLFANMMAGHTLLKILIGFAFTILSLTSVNNWLLPLMGFIPFGLVFIITFLETVIALLQAYVFTVLLCLYIKDLYVAH